MMLRVKLASEITGISKDAIVLLARVGLIRSAGYGRGLKVDYDDLVSLEPVVVEVAEELAKKHYDTGRRSVGKTFLYRLTEKRGLIPLSEVAKQFGMKLQTARNNCLYWCTVKKVLNKLYVVRDEKYERFVQRRLELMEKRSKR